MHRSMPTLAAALMTATATLSVATIAATPLAAQQASQAEPVVHRFVVAPQENEARYLVREQLASLDFPNDAVGRTAGITGGIAVTETGEIVADGTGFTIDMTSLATDNDRRDNYVRRNTLETEAHPTVTFVPTSFSGLGFPLAESGEATFTMTGDLTIRGVTRPTTWTVTATLANGAIRGEARTQFTFDEFEMTKPRVRSVLSVNDDIRLEYSFFLVPAR